MAASLPKIGVIIANWNRKSDTLRCLESVLASDYPFTEVLVVDNKSTDGSVEAILDIYPHIQLIQNKENLGFTGGYNTGIRFFLNKGIDFVFLLNNDAIIMPDTIQKLVQSAMYNPDAGFVGPIICSIKDPNLILTAGGLLLDGWKPWHRGTGELYRAKLDFKSEIDFLSGCALLVSKIAIETVGLLDEDYYAYHEEIDWCYRGKKAGFQLIFVPEAIALHPDNSQRDQSSAFVTYYITRNSLLFLKKHKKGSFILLSALTGYTRTLLSWSLRPRWRDKHMQRKALKRALVDFARSSFGKAESI